MPTLLDKVCEESKTSIEVVHLLLEMTTFLEELPSRTTPALVLPTETTMRITCVAAPPMATDPLLLLMGRMIMTLCHHESCSNPTASSCAMLKISSALIVQLTILCYMCSEEVNLDGFMFTRGITISSFLAI